MELSDVQMHQLRETELVIFKNFINICEQLKLSWFVAQGTLLGAVRHQGFIPWDDDIDVGMFREDFEVFLEKGQNLLGSEFFLQTCYTDPEYPFGYAKIRKQNTTFLETAYKDMDMNHGIYIDIFPFDIYSNNPFENAMLFLKKNLLVYRIRSSFYLPHLEKPTLKNFIHKIIDFFSKIIYPSATEARIKQDELYKSAKKGNRRINQGSLWGKKECVPEQWLQEITILEYEGLKVKAPYHYDAYLSQLYGDYMTPPPLEERVSHHYISTLSFTESYHPISNN